MKGVRLLDRVLSAESSRQASEPERQILHKPALRTIIPLENNRNALNDKLCKCTICEVCGRNVSVDDGHEGETILYPNWLASQEPRVITVHLPCTICV
jgi:hypothetical protein